MTPLRRLLASSVVLGLGLPVMLLAPVTTLPGSLFGPDRDGSVREISLAGLTGRPAVALRSPALEPAIRTGVDVVDSGQLRRVGRFSMLGVTWTPSTTRGALTLAPVTIRLRVHQHGRWGGWQSPQVTDSVPDLEHFGAAQRMGTDPVWTGPADGVQVSAVRRGGSAPRDLRLSLIDPGTRSGDGRRAPASSASADTGLPTVLTRAQWGAKERYAWWKPEYAAQVQGVVVHHTASTNSYTRATAAAQVRAIFSYHARSLDWGDIGYHYLVDKYGTIYEGRKGGMGSTVVGGHTYGFNHGSVGIALLGTYDKVRPTAAQMESVARVSSWVLANAHQSPLDPIVYTVDQAKNPRYRKGALITTRAIVGHRDLFPTTCPGRAAYGLLRALRSRVDALIGPEVTQPVVNVLGPVVSAAAVLRRASGWTAEATGPTGEVLQRWSGQGAAASITWSLDGLPRGSYQLAIGAGDGTGRTATPVVVTAQVTDDGVASSVLPTGLVARLADGTLWQVADGLAGQVRRAVPPWVQATLPGFAERAAGGVDTVLAALPAGAALGPREGALLRSATTNETFVVSGATLLPLGTLAARSQGYDLSQALTVSEADLAAVPRGEAVGTSGAHPAGTWARDSTGELWTTVSAADGRLLRRRVVSALAARSWVPDASLLTANSADTSLPVDPWQRGLADGVLYAGEDGAARLVSHGASRLLPAELLTRFGLRPAPGSDADLGHVQGQPPAADAPVPLGAVPAAASVTLLGRRVPALPASWTRPTFGNLEPAPVASDPVRP
jgi:hypothetical protein